MMYQIEISQQADRDLRKIFEHIAFELQTFETACKQLKRLEEGIISLSQMPKRFRQYEKEPWHSKGLRMMPIDNYCVFYITDEKQKAVNIVRIFYGGQNIQAKL